MGKKKGKREETFTFPEFDEGEYRIKETRDSKIALFAIFYAVCVAVISYSIVRMTDFDNIAFYLGFVAPYGLYQLLKALGEMKIVDVSEFERKNWFGPMFMSFIAWLGLFILLSNPPFNDIAKPKFQGVEVYANVDGEWNITSEPIEADTPFTLVIIVKDNWGVDSVSLAASKGGNGFISNELLVESEEGNPYSIEGKNRFYYFFEGGLDAEAYSFTFTATDSEGNLNTTTTTFTIG